ncbi:MAG TPA: hypothetical protein VHC97_19520 [Thermoanaerobaculia bacterium]|jgi:hypothetical protein|nr:hypothetical protein [Thermoanaerobaculia bacterium]
MHTRRDLLKGLLGAAAVVVAPPRPDLRVLQIGFRLPEGSSLQRGASLGMSEAKRTADLLRVALRWGATSGEVMIGQAAPAQEPSVPFLVAGVPEVIPRPPRPLVFRVASSPRVRREILSRQKRKDLRAVDWHPDLERFGAEQLNERFRRRFGQSMDEGAWHGWVAVKIATELALQIPPGASRTLISALQTSVFDGHKGEQLRFGTDHYLVQPVYLVDTQGRLVGEG